MKKRGLSLLETIVSVQILLIVSLFCMTMFGQGQRHDLRAREFSLCSTLANQKTQELSTHPPEQLRQLLANPIQGTFLREFAEFRFRASLTPYETGLSLLEVEATSPLGCRSRCTLLIPTETSGRGIVVDPHTSHIYFVRGPAGGPTSAALSSFQDTGSPSPTLVSTGAHPAGNPLSGVAGFPGHGFLWALSSAGPLGLEDLPAPPYTWQPPEAAPTSGDFAPQWHSATSDASCARAIFSDVANRCLWLFDSDTRPAPYWYDTPCRPTRNPLGLPGSVTTDPFGTLVWVADRENNCLRKFLFGAQPPPGYPLQHLEAWPPTGATVGYWDQRDFRPGNAFLGAPEGIAMTRGGSHVLVVDQHALWSFEETATASSWMQLVELGGLGRPAGLAIDAFGTTAYINCYDGSILKTTGQQPSTPPTWTPPAALVPGP